MAYPMVAEHVHTVTVAIKNSAVPDWDGRRYVLRRNLRRVARYARLFLNGPHNFFPHLVESVVVSLGPAVPDVAANKETMLEDIADEERTFLRIIYGETVDVDANCVANESGNAPSRPQRGAITKLFGVRMVLESEETASGAGTDVQPWTKTDL